MGSRSSANVRHSEMRVALRVLPEEGNERNS